MKLRPVNTLFNERVQHASVSGREPDALAPISCLAAEDDVPDDWFRGRTFYAAQACGISSRQATTAP